MKLGPGIHLAVNREILDIDARVSNLSDLAEQQVLRYCCNLIESYNRSNLEPCSRKIFMIFRNQYLCRGPGRGSDRIDREKVGANPAPKADKLSRKSEELLALRPLF